MSRISAISSTTPYIFGHISSGNKLMSAADGAAELAIVENEKAQVTGYNTGTKNLGDGTNMLILLIQHWEVSPASCRECVN